MNVSYDYVNKIMVDSRFKLSGINSDFTIELNENINIRPNTGCVVCDISIPKVWLPINERNNRFYFRIIESPSLYFDYIGILKPQNYDIVSLANALKTVIVDIIQNDYFDIKPNTDLGTIEISIKQTALITGFCLFTNKDLLTRVNSTWKGEYYITSNLFSVNSIIRNEDKDNITYTNANIFSTGVIDLTGEHLLYLTSNALTNYDNVGPNYQRNILKKIICNADYGSIIEEKVIIRDDYVNVSGMNLKTIDFRLVDAYNNIIDLRGAHISFSLLFVDI